MEASGEAGRIFCENLDFVWRVALSAAGNPSDAEDAVQDAYIKFVKGFAAFDRSRPVRPYLARVAVSAARDLARVEGRERRQVGRAAESVPSSIAYWSGTPALGKEAGPMAKGEEMSDPAEREELLDTLRQAMDRLDPSLRLAVALRHLHGLSLEETAEAIGAPRSTASDRVARGLAELRKMLAAAGFGAFVPADVGELRMPPPPDGLKTAISKLSGQGAAGRPGPEAEAQFVPAGAFKGGPAAKAALGAAALLAAAAAIAAAVGDGKKDSGAGGRPGPAAQAADKEADERSEAPSPDDWRRERWVPEEFLGALGGGPPVGPAVEAGGGGIALCGDKSGNIYVLNGNAIDIVTADGMLRRLAGTGARGYRDGPSNQAMFDQGGDYNVPRSIQCDGQGNIYTAENGNVRVRRIFKDKDGRWMVDTAAGGGRRVLKDGESCPPLEANLGGMIAVAAASDGTLTVVSSYLGVFRVDADRKAITKLGAWPGHVPQMADCDLKGNAYFIWRVDDGGVVRVSAEGKIERIAGMTHEEFLKAAGSKGGKPHHIGDGPPLTIYIDTPTSLAANPDGSCVYSCGGDEYDIRRIPTDLKTTSATLLCNGRWYVLPVHGNRNRGGVIFNPNLTGKSAAEGGSLCNLSVCHLHGRDYEGNLYGSVYPWVGATLSVEGSGQLRTKIFRLRRVK